MASDAAKPYTRVFFSASESRAPQWMITYWIGGMPSLTASARPSGLMSPFHAEKSRCSRPSSTSRCTSHENGAMLVAHHQSVSLL